MKIEDSITILAPRETVWRILSDPTFIPKLYRDAIAVEMDPPCPIAVGQKLKVYGRAQGLKISTYVEFTEVEKQKRLASRGIPGGMLSKFEQVVTITQNGWETQVSVSFEYEVQSELRAKLPDPTILDRLLYDSFRSFPRNLKELSELIPLPEQCPPES